MFVALNGYGSIESGKILGRNSRLWKERCGVMAELLKQSFELFVKNRWLKTIDKECDKYNKIKNKLSRQQYVVNSLLAEYKKKYGEDLRTPKERGGE